MSEEIGTFEALTQATPANHSLPDRARDPCSPAHNAVEVGCLIQPPGGTILLLMLEALTAYIGPAAGVATSVCWTGTSLFFTAAGRRLGPTLVNAFRIAFAA